MLQPTIFRQPSSAGFGKHLCAGCGTETEGIPVGGYCPACRRRRDRKAGRIARWIAVLTAVPIGLYALRLPPLPEFRLGAAAAVLIWFFLVRRVAKRVALEWIR